MCLYCWPDLSAYVINPLVANVPPIVVALIPNCNTFTTEDVKRDVQVLTDLLEKHLVPVLGPLVGVDSGKFDEELVVLNVHWNSTCRGVVVDVGRWGFATPCLSIRALLRSRPGGHPWRASIQGSRARDVCVQWPSSCSSERSGDPD